MTHAAFGLYLTALGHGGADRGVTVEIIGSTAIDRASEKFLCLTDALAEWQE